MKKTRTSPQKMFTMTVNQEFLDQIETLKKKYAIDSSAALIRFLVNEETKRNEDENSESPNKPTC